MKKVIWLLLIVACVCSGVRAATNFVKIVNVSNGTAQEATSYIDISTIVPNQSEILGFSVTSAVKNTFSPYASLWDETALSDHSESNLFGESEALANTSKDKAFGYPKKISNQVKVILGPYSAISIEYVK